MEYISDIRAFVNVVQKRNFSAAAVAMDTTQPAISKRLARLEKSLGVQLLKRSTRHLSLTEAGSDFYKRAERILAELEEASKSAASVNNGVRGLLRVHATLGIGQSFVAPAVAEFIKDNTDLTVQLILAPNDTVNLMEDVDVTIRLETEEDRLRGKTSISRRVLGSISYLICGSPIYFDRAGVPKTPYDLEHHNCLVFSVRESSQLWSFTSPKGDYSVRVSGTYSCNSSASLYEALRQGVGLARMPEHLVSDDLKNGWLKAVFSDFTRPPRSIIAYSPKAVRVPAKTQGLLDFLTLILKRRLADSATRV